MVSVHAHANLYTSGYSPQELNHIHECRNFAEDLVTAEAMDNTQHAVFLHQVTCPFVFFHCIQPELNYVI